MRKLWSTLGCATVAAALAMPALAIDPPPITVPTLPTVSVPTPPPLPPAPPPPTVAVPAVPAPTPKPSVPAQPPVTSPVPKPSAPSPSSSQSAPKGQSSSPSSGATPSSSSAASSGAATARGHTPPRVRTSRGWAAASSKRPTAIVVTVPSAGVVELRVTQVAPLCRAAGRIVVRAHAGTNVVHFRGRVQGRSLAPGTYRITPRIRGGRTLKAIVLVVVAGSAPARGELAAGRRANVCGASGSSARGGAPSAARSSATSSSVGSRGAEAKKATHGAVAAFTSPKPKARGGVLGAEFTQPLRDPTKGANPLILVLLALAIGLLALAALPRTVIASPVLAEQLTNRRLELALAGTGTLLVVVLAYLLLV